MTGFDEALGTIRGGDGVWTAHVPPGWMQGRTAFGGLTAGYAVRALEAATDRPLRAVDIYFLAPVVPGPIDIVLEPSRSGKYITHFAGKVIQQGATAVSFHAVAADGLDSAYNALPPSPHVSKHRHQCLEMPYLADITPQFSQNFQMLLGEGDLPFSGSGTASVGGFVRHRAPATGLAALLAHIDAWPPPVLPLLTRPAAASTVRWSAHVHGDVRTADGQQWSWFRADARWRSEGLSTATGLLMRDGVPLVFSEQTIALYPQRR